MLNIASSSIFFVLPSYGEDIQVITYSDAEKKDIMHHSIDAVFPSVYKCIAGKLGNEEVLPPFEIGTAFVIHPSGLFVTCNHVVRNHLTGVLLDQNNQHHLYNVVGRAPQYDLAILQTIVPVELTPVRISSSLSVNYNSIFCAIGNTDDDLLAFRGFLMKKKGNVDSMNSLIANAMTFDMSVDNGCSGGPVFDPKGNVIGVIQSAVTEKRMYLVAAPIESIEKACQDTLNLQSYTGYTSGLSVETQEQGLFVTGVQPNSPAEKSGIQKGDKIISLGPWSTKDKVSYTLSEFIWVAKNNDKTYLPLKILSSKNGQELSIDIALEKECIPSDSVTRDNLIPGCSFIMTSSEGENVSGWTHTLDITSIGKSKIKFIGFFEFPQEGSYGFRLDVPGTGKLTIGEHFSIEKNEAHPKMQSAKRAFFANGFHKFTLDIELEQIPSNNYLTVTGSSESEVLPNFIQKSIWGKQKD